METLVFLFPQLNYFFAAKEEEYFKMLGPEDLQAHKMKDKNTSAVRLKEKNGMSRLSLLLTKSGSHENVSTEKTTATATNKISPEAALIWSDSFEELLKHSDGVATFSNFLRTEFSEENIEFWLACEDYKTTESESKLLSKAKQMYAVFIVADAPKEINIDHSTRMAIHKNIVQPTKSCFEAAQSTVYSLMKKDCYPRFLVSDIYLCLTKRKTPRGTLYRRRSRSCVFTDRAEATADSSVWL